MSDDQIQRTASGRVLSQEELEKAEEKEGVVEDASKVLEDPEQAPKKLGAFGRSGSAKQMIRQGSSSARR